MLTVGYQAVVLRATEVNVITYKISPDAMGTVMSVAGERQKAEPMPAFSLLRLSALARLGYALIVIASLWAAVLWALA